MVKGRMTWMDKLVLGVIFAAFCIYGSTKPPGPPAPATFNIPLAVEVDYNSLYIMPDIPERFADALYGKQCDVQLRTDNGGWQTIKTIPAYDLLPVRATGIYVSGGQGRVRSVRLVWPDVQYESEEEALP